MRLGRRTTTAVVAGGAGVAAAAALAFGPGQANLTNVTNANPKASGVSAPNIVSPELADVLVAQGSMKLDGGTSAVPYYGYDGNGTLLPALGSNAEATKTEPDKNTYVVFEQG